MMTPPTLHSALSVSLSLVHCWHRMVSSFRDMLWNLVILKQLCSNTRVHCHSYLNLAYILHNTENGETPEFSVPKRLITWRLISQSAFILCSIQSHDQWIKMIDLPWRPQDTPWCHIWALSTGSICSGLENREGESGSQDDENPSISLPAAPVKVRRFYFLLMNV